MKTKIKKKDKSVRDVMFGGNDMKRFVNRMKEIDKSRIERIKEAKAKKKLLSLAQMYTSREIKNANKILSPAQQLAIQLITDFVNNYTMTYVANRCGVQEATLSSWRNDPIFIRECMKQTERRQAFGAVHAMKNINRAIMRGSVKDSWKYLEMIGMAKNKLEVDFTGTPQELADEELEQEVAELQESLEKANVPSEN